MAIFATKSANIRMANEDGKRICTLHNVSPTVSATTAAAFVGAIETIHNNGPCTARMNVVMDIER